MAILNRNFSRCLVFAATFLVASTSSGSSLDTFSFNDIKLKVRLGNITVVDDSAQSFEFNESDRIAEFDSGLDGVNQWISPSSEIVVRGAKCNAGQHVEAFEINGVSVIQKKSERQHDFNILLNHAVLPAAERIALPIVPQQNILDQCLATPAGSVNTLEFTQPVDVVMWCVANEVDLFDDIKEVSHLATTANVSVSVECDRKIIRAQISQVANSNSYRSQCPFGWAVNGTHSSFKVSQSDRPAVCVQIRRSVTNHYPDPDGDGPARAFYNYYCEDGWFLRSTNVQNETSLTSPNKNLLWCLPYPSTGGRG